MLHVKCSACSADCAMRYRYQAFIHHGVYRLHEAANTYLPQQGQCFAQHISKADGRRDCGKLCWYYTVSEKLQRDRNYCVANPSAIQSSNKTSPASKHRQSHKMWCLLYFSYCFRSSLLIESTDYMIYIYIL